MREDFWSKECGTRFFINIFGIRKFKVLDQILDNFQILLNILNFYIFFNFMKMVCVFGN